MFEHEQSGGRKALCVVPDRDTFDLLQGKLADCRCSADYAAEISAALEAADNADYDVYIVEHCWLADGHGLEFCRQIRRKDTATPVLFYSRNVAAFEISQALAAGAQAYVSFSLELLPRRVEQLVKTADARDREAFKEELRCIREQLAARMQTLGTLIKTSEKHFHDSADDALRAHAFAEFVRAGGKRALFDRLYPRAYREASDLAAGPAMSNQS